MRMLLLLFPLVAAAQFPLHLDLSGSWKYRAGDDGNYSELAVDDSAWREVEVPIVRVPSRGRFLLRKSFDFPAGADGKRLVLTFGHMVALYRISINGTRIAEATEVTPKIRLFDVPEGLIRPGRNVIAIQCQGAAGVDINGLDVVPDQGPYLLTYHENALAILPALSVERRLRAGTMNVLTSGLLTLLALLSIILWFGERSRRELLMLGGFLLSDAILRLGVYLTVLYGWKRVETYFVLHLGLVLMAYLTMHILGSHPRWLQAIMWLQAVYGTARFFMVQRPALASLWQALAFLLLGFALVRVAVLWKERQPLRLPVTVVIVLLIYCQRNTTLQLFPVHFTAGGYLWNAYDMAMLSAAFVLILLLLSGLTADRREKLRLANEMEAARAVQQLLLPAGEPVRGSFAIDAVYLPAHEVGGDFYQIAERGADSCLVLAGDVSGKGLQAAMVASVAVGAFRSTTSNSPAEILSAINRAVCADGRTGFVTCVCARFDRDRIVMANAGHPAPYADGQEVSLDGGLPLGISPDAQYAETIWEGVPAQATFLSDGVIEAAPAGGELFGFERTAAVSTSTAAAIAEAARAWGQNDDITVVTVRRTA